MEITYNITRADQWRLNLYVMFHRWQTTLNFLVTPILWAIFSAYFALGRERSLRAVLIGLFIGAFGGAALNALVLWASILKRLPTPATRRVCTTLITPEFFRDTEPKKVMEYRWVQITDIRLHDGDFYFWVGGIKGNFIPRSAFANPREGHLFYETAMTFWRSARAGRSVPGPQDGEVWPPPPRLG